MTVICLKAIDKAYIADAFTSKTQTATELAITYGRSRRTIIRVLEEMGIDPGVRHRRPKEIEIDIPLTFTGYPVNLPGPAWEFFEPSPPTPWYRKVLKFVGIHV